MEKTLRFIFVFLMSVLGSLPVFIICFTFGLGFKIAIIAMLVVFVLFIDPINLLSKKLNIQSYKNVIVAFVVSIFIHFVYKMSVNLMDSSSENTLYEYLTAIQPFIGLIYVYISSLLGIFLSKQTGKVFNKN